MNGLRIYINPASPDAPSLHGVFYSRRGDGPYYLWHFDEKVEQWRGARMHSTDLAFKALSVASWKAVPGALQTKLNEHYLE